MNKHARKNTYVIYGLILSVIIVLCLLYSVVNSDKKPAPHIPDQRKEYSDEQKISRQPNQSKKSPDTSQTAENPELDLSTENVPNNQE